MEKKKTNIKQSRFQISLRSCLLLITLVALCFGWVAKRAHQQRSIVEWVITHGGQVCYEYETADPFDVDIPPAPKWLIDLLGVDFFDDVRYVRLGQRVSDLSPITGLRRLETLDAANSRVRDLTPIANLGTLRWINVNFTEVEVLEPLAGLRHLQEIDIIGTRVSDLGPLTALKDLQELRLAQTPITDLSPLAELSNLTRLDIAQTPITDLSPLAELSNLKKLNISNCRVSELDAVTRLKQLKELNLYGTAIREDRSDELQRLLPDCRLDWYDWYPIDEAKQSKAKQLHGSHVEASTQEAAR